MRCIYTVGEVKATELQAEEKSSETGKSFVGCFVAYKHTKYDEFE